MTEEEEVEGVGQMIAYYCKKKHGGDGKTRCPECEELYQYVKVRRHLCPFGDDKPFCANCKIHCYKPDMREKIRAVMRYAAPRVTFVHPIMAFRHLSETIKTNRRNKKNDKLIRKEAAELGVPYEELKKKRAQEAKIAAVKAAKAKQAAAAAQKEGNNEDNSSKGDN